MPITHCICYEVSFEELWAWAQEHNAGLEELQEEFHCGTGCGMCVPYLKRMLRTGETVIPPPPPGTSANAD